MYCVLGCGCDRTKKEAIVHILYLFHSYFCIETALSWVSSSVFFFFFGFATRRFLFECVYISIVCVCVSMCIPYIPEIGFQHHFTLNIVDEFARFSPSKINLIFRLNRGTYSVWLLFEEVAHADELSNVCILAIVLIMSIRNMPHSI